MTAPILVTGGTGTLGRQVVALLLAAAHPVRVLTRAAPHPGDGIELVVGDLLKNEGLEHAVQGVEVIVHLAGGPKGDGDAAAALVAAAKGARVGHIVMISVIGADTIPLGFLRAKHEAETAVVTSGIPYSILRAAQFDELVLTMVRQLSKSPIVVVPGMTLQPVDSREVAARIAELAVGRPVGRVADLAGPQDYAMRDLVEGYLKTRGKRRLMMPLRIPGKAGKAYRAGDNLAVRGTRGTLTWEDFLSSFA